MPSSEGSYDDLILAQSGDVEVYFDAAGNRFILDARTGELIAVQPPRRQSERRAVRRLNRERDSDRERFYLDDPEDMERLVRRRLDDLNRDAPVATREPTRRNTARAPIRRDLLPVLRAPARPAPKATPQEPAVVAREPAREKPVRRKPVRRDPLPVIEEPAEALPAEVEALPATVEQPAPAKILPAPDDVSPEPTEIYSEPPEALPEPAEIMPEPAEPQVAARDPLPESPLNEPGFTTLQPPATDGMAPSSEPPVTIEAPVDSKSRTDVAELQILLDRAGASPGVIDGKFGENVDKALAAYGLLTGENLKSTDAIGIKTALEATGGDAFVEYEITAQDAAGPFVASVPEDYGEKAKLDRLSYTSVAEMLAERFHMDEAYLKALNPEANFGRAGTRVRVAAIGGPIASQAKRIIADKAGRQVRVFDAEDGLIAVYPATIGSGDTPSPEGTHKVARVAFDPDYTYNPNVNFKQGENDQVLTIPPGPNGPVGSVWIALSKPTYGIHGTPEPSKIGKTESHGCVRLTNWDAQELAKIVSAGVEVEFAE